MKVRTGPGPLDWRDEGPASAHSVVRYSAISGAPVGHMVVPPSTGSLPVTMGEALRRRGRREERKRWVPSTAPRKERPVCGRFMPLAKTTCARGPNHKDSCRSREVMDTDTAVRRARETVE